MSLPVDFVASATALECYAACPRRFRQRYIDHLPTAGPDAATVEQMRRGNLFHRLVLWDGLGLDTSLILDAEGDPNLQAHWEAYRAFNLSLAAGATIEHDRVLTARSGEFAVQARLDALAYWPDGDVTIFDWKTSACPDHARLEASPQSKVYPFVVWNVLSRRADLPLGDPAQIRLVYWFPEDGQNPLQIPCSHASIVSATDWLHESLETIAADTTFAMTGDRTVCKTCEYLAHCGVQPEDGDGWAFDEDYYYLPEPDEASEFDDAGWPA